MSSLDIRFILAHPLIYRLFSAIVGQGSARKIYVDEYIRPPKESRILDIGCGPADILKYLPAGTDYVGFDMSEEYIEAARKTFGKRGKFLCERLTPLLLENLAPFDLVIAIGVLHHLEDTEAQKLFALAYKALKPGGRLVTIDPVFFKGQSTLERYLISRDRGKFVRSDQVYPQLIPEGFTDVKTEVRRGLLRMPYSLLFMECHK